VLPKKDYQGAIEDMLDVIPLAPNNPSVYYNISCYFSLN
jgi:hypothetical protein